MTDKRIRALIRERTSLAGIGLYTFLTHGIDDDRNCDCGKLDCKAPGKHPLFSGIRRGATIDLEKIKQETRISTANIGLHFGLSNLVAVDVDPRNGGSETFANLLQKHPGLESAVVAETGGGGEHHFFRASEDVIYPARLGPGVDLLSGNKYAILPPSRHHSGGRYRWRHDCDPISSEFLMTFLPQSILELFRDSEQYTLTEPIVESEAAIASLGSALSYLSADCSYDEWRDAIFAINSTGWACAEEMARKWSMAAPHRWSEEAFAAVWESANPAHPGGRTIASIYFAAKRSGWIDPNGPARAETLGDIDNGWRIANVYRGKLIYDQASRKWREYSNGIWRVCDTGQHIAAGKDVAETILREAAASFAAQPTDANKASYSQALKVHRSAPRIYAAIEMAAAEPGMSVANPAAFDADPYLLGVEGGAIDLRTGNWLPPLPSRMISKCVGVRYDANAKCPVFKGFLNDILPNKDEVRFLQRFAGYTLTGSVEEEVLLFMQGAGANGKSVLANVLSRVLGDYAVTVGAELLAVTKNDGEALRFKARLRGSRMALVNEVGQNDTFNDQRVKEVVSREAMPSRQLYGEAYDFVPTHKLWVRGNHRPAVLDSGDGMWRRIILLPFPRQFKPDERVPNLDQQLLDEEGSGILNWCIAGCLNWQKDRLGIPPSILRETAQYRDETDVVGEWIEAECEVGPGFRSYISDLYHFYRSYFEQAGMVPKSQAGFTRMMQPKGFKRIKSNGTGYLHGIRLIRKDI